MEIFKNLDTSDVVLSDQVVRKIGKLMEISHKNPARHTSKVRMAFSRVVVVALVVMSIKFTAMMSISAIRNAVWNAIVEWYDKYISVDNETDDPVSLLTVIEGIRKPTLLPQGGKKRSLLIGMLDRRTCECVSVLRRGVPDFAMRQPEDRSHHTWQERDHTE